MTMQHTGNTAFAVEMAKELAADHSTADPITTIEWVARQWGMILTEGQKLRLLAVRADLLTGVFGKRDMPKACIAAL